MSEWHPIETAPADRYILVFTPDTPGWDGNMYVARWWGDEPVGKGTAVTGSCFWTCGGPNGGMDLDCKFTHWMELPKAP